MPAGSRWRNGVWPAKQAPERPAQRALGYFGDLCALCRPSFYNGNAPDALSLCSACRTPVTLLLVLMLVGLADEKLRVFDALRDVISPLQIGLYTNRDQLAVT
jgi:hypothetical protein